MTVTTAENLPKPDIQKRIAALQRERSRRVQTELAHRLESPPENIARKFKKGPDHNQEAFLTDLGRLAAERNFDRQYRGDPFCWNGVSKEESESHPEQKLPMILRVARDSSGARFDASQTWSLEPGATDGSTLRGLLRF
jgi:hypothetical protein